MQQWSNSIIMVSAAGEGNSKNNAGSQLQVPPRQVRLNPFVLLLGPLNGVTDSNDRLQLSLSEINEIHLIAEDVLREECETYYLGNDETIFLSALLALISPLEIINSNDFDSELSLSTTIINNNNLVALKISGGVLYFDGHSKSLPTKEGAQNFVEWVYNNNLQLLLQALQTIELYQNLSIASYYEWDDWLNNHQQIIENINTKTDAGTDTDTDSNNNNEKPATTESLLSLENSDDSSSSSGKKNNGAVVTEIQSQLKVEFYDSNSISAASSYGNDNSNNNKHGWNGSSFVVVIIVAIPVAAGFIFLLSCLTMENNIIWKEENIGKELDRESDNESFGKETYSTSGDDDDHHYTTKSIILPKDINVDDNLSTNDSGYTCDTGSSGITYRNNHHEISPKRSNTNGSDPTFTNDADDDDYNAYDIIGLHHKGDKIEMEEIDLEKGEMSDIEVLEEEGEENYSKQNQEKQIKKNVDNIEVVSGNSFANTSIVRPKLLPVTSIDSIETNMQQELESDDGRGEEAPIFTTVSIVMGEYDDETLLLPPSSTNDTRKHGTIYSKSQAGQILQSLLPAKSLMVNNNVGSYWIPKQFQSTWMDSIISPTSLAREKSEESHPIVNSNIENNDKDRKKDEEGEKDYKGDSNSGKTVNKRTNNNSEKKNSKYYKINDESWSDVDESGNEFEPDSNWDPDDNSITDADASANLAADRNNNNKKFITTTPSSSCISMFKVKCNNNNSKNDDQNSLSSSSDASSSYNDKTKLLKSIKPDETYQFDLLDINSSPNQQNKKKNRRVTFAAGLLDKQEEQNRHQKKENLESDSDNIIRDDNYVPLSNDDDINNDNYVPLSNDDTSSSPNLNVCASSTQERKQADASSASPITTAALSSPTLQKTLKSKVSTTLKGSLNSESFSGVKSRLKPTFTSIKHITSIKNNSSSANSSMTSDRSGNTEALTVFTANGPIYIFDDEVSL